MTRTASFYYLFLYQASFVVSTYLLKVQVQQHIYLRDNKRHSVAMSQRRNNHMHVYVIILEGK